ncbi:MAG: hypothetical protein LUF30_04860 [Lachnospiraceae bacterium]|nr:hypothetical protein [Lachnospiraceae bacterium]
MNREEYISDELVIKRANAAVAIELEKKKALDLPAVVYDPTTEAIYHIYSDGSKVEIGKKMRKGRYSERIKKAKSNSSLDNS